MIKDLRKRLQAGETIHVEPAPGNYCLFDLVPLQGDEGYSTYTIHVYCEQATQPAPIDEALDAWARVLNEKRFDLFSEILGDDEGLELEREWSQDYNADIARGLRRSSF